MSHFQPSGVAQSVIFNCCYMGCGAQHESRVPLEVWSFPVQLAPITLCAPPMGWEVRGRLVICPAHRSPGASVH